MKTTTKTFQNHKLAYKFNSFYFVFLVTPLTQTNSKPFKCKIFWIKNSLF